MIEYFDLRGSKWPPPVALQGIANTPGLQRLETLNVKQRTLWRGICQMVRFKVGLREEVLDYL